jgi:uncharacterized protein
MITGRILAITGGHSVDMSAFSGMLNAICAEREWLWSHSVQPNAQGWFDEQRPGEWDAILCHDIPGLALKRGEPPQPISPTTGQRADIAGMLDWNQGMVVIHHSLAGWPTWDAWATALGGRFNYAPGRLRGVDWPSSGTRIETYTAQVVAPSHPVCAGLNDWELTDELYCCPVFDDEVVPLLRTNADMSPELFISTYEHVIVGEDAAPKCHGHPVPSNLIAWATVAGNSPIVYIQPGDSAATFSLPMYRRLVGNALAWVSSEEAHDWAEVNARPIDWRTAPSAKWPERD